MSVTLILTGILTGIETLTIGNLPIGVEPIGTVPAIRILPGGCVIDGDVFNDGLVIGDVYSPPSVAVGEVFIGGGLVTGQVFVDGLVVGEVFPGGGPVEGEVFCGS